MQGASKLHLSRFGLGLTRPIGTICSPDWKPALALDGVAHILNSGRTACRSLVRLAGCCGPGFERLRFRRILLTQKDCEHDIERDHQIFRLPGFQGCRPEFSREQKRSDRDRRLVRERTSLVVSLGAENDIQAEREHKQQQKRY
jgi:hypothetical protein